MRNFTDEEIKRYAQMFFDGVLEDARNYEAVKDYTEKAQEKGQVEPGRVTVKRNPLKEKTGRWWWADLGIPCDEQEDNPNENCFTRVWVPEED